MNMADASILGNLVGRIWSEQIEAPTNRTASLSNGHDGTSSQHFARAIQLIAGAPIFDPLGDWLGARYLIDDPQTTEQSSHLAMAATKYLPGASGAYIPEYFHTREIAALPAGERCRGLPAVDDDHEFWRNNRSPGLQLQRRRAEPGRGSGDDLPV